MERFIFVFSLSIVVTLLGSFAHAGSGSFSGGFGVVCFRTPEPAEILRKTRRFDPTTLPLVTSVEALDFFEARQHRGLTPGSALPYTLILPSARESRADYLGRIITRSRTVAPIFADLLQKFKRDRHVLKKDLKHFVIPDDTLFPEAEIPGCALAAIGANEVNVEKKTHKIYIYQPLFEKMNANQQTMLLLHEYLYVIARWQGQRDSRIVRILIDDLIKRKEVYTMVYVFKNFAHLFSGSPRYEEDMFFFDAFRYLIVHTPYFESSMKIINSGLTRATEIHKKCNELNSTIDWHEEYCRSLGDLVEDFKTTQPEGNLEQLVMQLVMRARF